MLAAITVDSLLDNFDPDAPTTDGVVTLREAIVAANTNMVAGDAPAGEPGADTIDFTVGGTIDIGSQLPAITEAVTIDGGGQITIDAGNGVDGTFLTQDGYRIFEIDDRTPSQIDVVLHGLTLKGGDVHPYASPPNGGAILNHENLTITGSTIHGNASGRFRGDGGGIFNVGTAAITGSVISGNSANVGGGIFNGGMATITSSTISGNNDDTLAAPRSGGGIFNIGTLGVTNSTISNNTDGGVSSAGFYPTATITDSTISGNTRSGIHSNSSTVNIIGTTVSDNLGRGIDIFGGTTNIISSTISGNSESDRGGGVFNRSGTVTVTDSTITANTAIFRGGGIYNFDPDANLTVIGSTISENIATQNGYGGGIFNSSGATAVITSSTISGNSASDRGGGIYSGDRTTVTASTISGNKAGRSGGGIFAAGHNTVIINSTISANVASSDDSSTVGGGIFANRAVTISGTTIWGNSADLGGGIFNNRPSTLTNSIVAGNMLGGDTSGFFSESSHNNLVEDGGSEFPPLPLDTISGDPLLGPLADNGGPTLTHALLPGSPALDAGNIGIIDPPMYDQRGVPFLRIVDGNVPADVVIDIGAYEAQAIPTSVPGDYNRDGTISLSDYTVWRNNLGASVAPLYGADGDGNGVVDHADYRVWRGHFGITYAMSAPVAASHSGPAKSNGPGPEAAFAMYKSPTSSASISQPSLDASDPTSRDVADQPALLLPNRAESESEPTPASVELRSSSATSESIELALELDWDEI